jgi:hypothetical protein
MVVVQLYMKRSGGVAVCCVTLSTIVQLMALCNLLEIGFAADDLPRAVRRRFFG